MLSEHFARLIYPEGSEQQRAFIEQLFTSSVEGNLCLEANEEVQLPASVALDNPEEPLPSTPLCRFGSLYYLQKNWVFETRVLREVVRLSAPIEELPASSLEGLNAEQQQAVGMALARRLTLITGGPGTGKTFTAGRIVEAVLNAQPSARVLLAAPTGKATSRLEASLTRRGDIRSGTLHSLLRLGKQPRFLEEGKALLADLILVDEASMIDAGLFALLLASVPEDARLVLMGDGAQLPPVEAGSLFSDLLESGSVPSVCLNTCLRSDQQELLALAEAARAGDAEILLSHLSSLDPLEEAIRHYPGPSAEEPDPEQVRAACEEFKILSCVRKGPLGVDRLNRAIFDAFTEQMEPGNWLAVPLLITENDRRTGLYNGDTGILMLCHHFEERSYALFPGGKRAVSRLPRFEYAYALSVHKSQGSEYAHLLLLASSGAENFGREVLYTAVTRAKRSLQIAGDKEAIRRALLHSVRRRSGLCARLIDKIRLSTREKRG